MEGLSQQERTPAMAREQRRSGWPQKPKNSLPGKVLLEYRKHSQLEFDWDFQQ
jgi:hypothetical protein